MARVGLGLSGGVDSAVAAHLLLEAGHKVTAFYMQLTPDSHGSQDEADARDLAREMGMEFHVLDGRAQFEKRIIQPFISAYGQGQTPNPCVLCNGVIKFGWLWEAVQAYGCDRLATGHYAQLGLDASGRHRLLRAVSPTKDQSYFMHRVPPDLLPQLILPLGGMQKEEVRALASKLDLPVARKKDSQEVCFIPGDDYAAFLASRGLQGSSGDFVDGQGEVLGQHRGIEHYTIGQRRGLGLALGYPAYVTALDAKNSQVSVGPDAALWKRGLIADDVHFHRPIASGEEGRALAKIRSRGAAAAAQWRYDGQNLMLRFEEPQRAISPGQACVLYEDEMVLGGARILQAFPNGPEG